MFKSRIICNAILVCSLLLLQLPAQPLATSSRPDSSPGTPTVALVLEGGGALGLAHVGVITVIEALGIPIDIVVGTSMGAIVGGLYAVGYDSTGLEAIALETDWLELFAEHVPARSDPYRTRVSQSRYFTSIPFDRYGLRGSGGLLTGMKILTYMDCLVSGIPSPIDFDALPRRFRAVATDISTGREVVLQDGSISDAMRASMSIPGVFAPHRINDWYLMDGGIVNNLPIDVARAMGADLIIAVDLQGGFNSKGLALGSTSLENMARTIDIMIQANVEKQLPGADLVIQVDLQDFTVMDFAKSKQLIDQGKAAARDQMEALKELQERIGRSDSLPATVQETVPASVQETVPATRYGTVPTGWTEFPLKGLYLDGGSAQDRAAVQRLIPFTPGVQYSPRELATCAVALYSDRQLESLRLQHVYSDDPHDGVVLRVAIQSRKTAGSYLRLGLDYSGTYTDRVANRMTVTPGLIIRDWPLPGSELSMNLELLNTLRFETSLHQLIADQFFFKADFSYRRDFRILAFSADVTPGVDQIFYRMATRLGISAGIYPFPGAMVFLGLARDWSQDTLSLDVPDYLLAQDITVLQLGSSILRTDSPIFPMDGFAFDLRLTEGLSLLGASSTFRTVTTRGETYLSFSSPVSLGLLWKAGLDFSGSMASEASAPLAYKPSLTDRRLFPALLTADEQLGMAVLGAGLELKLQLNRLSSAIGIPSFILVQGSTGTAQRDELALVAEAPSLYWSAAVGAGIRASDAFGLSVRLGGAGRPDGKLVPFFAIDLGAIGRRE
jgi:NTE family protein